MSATVPGARFSHPSIFYHSDRHRQKSTLKIQYEIHVPNADRTLSPDTVEDKKKLKQNNKYKTRRKKKHTN